LDLRDSVSSPEEFLQQPFTFLATPPEEGMLERCRVALLPVPYDGTATFRAGAREGPRAIIEASIHLEDYILEMDADPSLAGIHTAPFLEPMTCAPELMVERVRSAVAGLCQDGRLVGVLGGDHSVAIGAVRAIADAYPGLSVLYLDAHADLRDAYAGTPFGHASVARRIWEICHLVQVGVRSMSAEERDFIQEQRIQCIAQTGLHLLDDQAIEDIVSQLGQRVYISLDLDVLDPSLMSAVGVPEPGGLGWWEVLRLLRRVGETRQVVGFDVSELCPPVGPASCASVAAALTYRLIGYAMLPYHEKRTQK
jgi:agmatinase